VPPPYIDDWALTAGGYHNAYFTVNGGGQRVPYSTDFTEEHAASLLQKYEATDTQPWFMYVGTNALHLVTEPEAAYAQAPVGDWAENPAVFEQTEATNRRGSGRSTPSSGTPSPTRSKFGGASSGP
jgi:hypothetical protein